MVQNLFSLNFSFNVPSQYGIICVYSVQLHVPVLNLSCLMVTKDHTQFKYIPPRMTGLNDFKLSHANFSISFPYKLYVILFNHTNHHPNHLSIVEKLWNNRTSSSQVSRLLRYGPRKTISIKSHYCEYLGHHLLT